jgi:hypothetical protein
MVQDKSNPTASATPVRWSEEDRLVAELEELGIHYLSRQSDCPTPPPRPPRALLADIVRQPSSRMRMVLIALLISHPTYAESGQPALKLLQPEEQDTFKILYTAAVFLQREYIEALKQHMPVPWSWLPDLFSAELGIPPLPARDGLKALAQIHAQKTGAYLNWYGTYHHPVEQWLRRQELELQWSRSLPIFS